MTIVNYDRNKHQQFIDMLVEYFNDIPEHITRGRILDLFHAEQQQSIIQIALCLDNQNLIGLPSTKLTVPKATGANAQAGDSFASSISPLNIVTRVSAVN